jgi:hypothetical protein
MSTAAVLHKNVVLRIPTYIFVYYDYWLSAFKWVKSSMILPRTNNNLSIEYNFLSSYQKNI